MRINTIYKSDIRGSIRRRTNQGKMNESRCWCELSHTTGRILSYLFAVKILFSAQRQWPELFENFEISHVRSSTPGLYPLRNNRFRKSPAETIISRMTSDAVKMSSYKAYAKELQLFELDKRILHFANPDVLRPIVHAEILVRDSLERDGITYPSQFFNGWKYIGCSKPTCQLCAYYFSSLGNGLEVRPTHGNLYVNWRMPDVDDSQGQKAVKQRQDLMNKILVQIRQEAFRIMRERAPGGKRHDSNTDPTYLNDAVSSQDSQSAVLGNMLKNLNIGSSENGAWDGIEQLNSDLSDQEDGGVRI